MVSSRQMVHTNHDMTLLHEGAKYLGTGLLWVFGYYKGTDIMGLTP